MVENWSLLATIGLVFLVTLLGAYLRARVKDRCLKDFAGFHVTIERANGKLIWGTLRLEATGLELIYTDTLQDEKHIESSYILYASEYQDIQTVYRYVDRLSDKEKRRRTISIRRSFHPNPLRRLGRSARNFLGAATDSLQEVIALLLGQFQKAGRRYLVERTDATLSKLGSKYIGEMSRQADPLLERHIGQKVVFEIVEGDEVHEHVGVFKEYSGQFLEFLDIRYPQAQILPVHLEESLETERVRLSYTNGIIKAENLQDDPLLLECLCWDDREQPLNVVVDGGEAVELYLPEKVERPELHLRSARELDMIVPRTRCVVRHRAESAEPESLRDALFDVVFDLGTALGNNVLREARERRLRQDLAEDAHNLSAATALAGILIQKEEYAEAEKLLHMALAAEESLPDRGRRARMELRELKRRQTAASLARQEGRGGRSPRSADAATMSTMNTSGLQ